MIVSTAPASGAPVNGIHDFLADLARRQRDDTAIVCGPVRMTFGQLAARSDDLAARLAGHGAVPGAVVGVLVERGADLAAALFAVLKTGAAYVPLDPDLPAARMESMLAAAGAGLVLTQRELAGRLPGRCLAVLVSGRDPGARAVPRPRLTPDDLAYVLYTSGSTGRPKGVLVPHRGLINLLNSHLEHLFADAARAAGGRRLRVAHTAALSYDASWAPLMWMLAGHELHMVGQQTRLDPHALVRLLAAERIDVLDETPAYLRALIQAGLLEGEHRPRVIVTGGEAVDQGLRSALSAAGRSDATLTCYNSYGTTETSVENLICEVAEADGPVLGRPIAGSRAYVLDSALRQVPPGTPGELYLGGPGLARGYLGQAGQTASSFLADPFGGPGSRMYRTGDLVRRRTDGLLDFLGRSDDQVKINGIRVEPVEAEVALRRHPALVTAVVLPRRDATGRDRLIGYVVPEADREPPTSDGLRTFLSQTLPQQLIPSRFVALTALPLTPAGKVDRRALPDPLAGPPTGPGGHGRSYVPPRNPAEELIAGIWREVFGIERIGALDDFVELGGDSIAAMRVVAALNRRHGTALPAQTVFERRTVRGLAAGLPAERPGAAGPAIHDAAAHDAATHDDEGAAGPGAALPLSFGQQRLWFLDEFHPGGAEYNTCAGFRLRGALDLAALTGALNQLVARHESLRTTFHTIDGRGAQIINPPFPVRLDTKRVASSADLAGADLAGADLERVLLDEVTRPFDLQRGPLLRALLLELGHNDHALVLCLHHIVTDGWSMGVLADELGRLYSGAVRGQRAALPPLPFRYADFAAWQRDRLAGPAMDEQVAYWERQLSGVPAIELPADRPRPAVRTSAGATHRFTVPAPLTARLAGLGRGAGATLFTTLIAATQVFLARYTGQRDIAVGTATAGRARGPAGGLETGGLENLVGFFVNTVVIRGRPQSRLSFAEFLARTRPTVLDALANEEVPFDRLVDLLLPERDASRPPLVQVMVVLQNAPSPPPVMAGLRVEDLDLPRRSAVFDLTLEFEPADGELRTTMEYSTDLFDAATIERMSRHLLVLLDGITTDPHCPLSELPLLPAADLRLLLGEWNGPAQAQACSTVPGLFAARVRERPTATAVTCEGTGLTYRELDERANRLAHGLIARGARPRDRIAVCARRGIDTIAAMLAVLKAGGAYVPLDPDYPPRRLAFLIEDCGARLVLAGDEHRDRLPATITVAAPHGDWCAGYPAGPPPTAAAVAPDDLACVMYTSGSSGQPKGVLIEHRCVAHLCADQHARFDAGDVVSQCGSLCFDASTFEIWGALLSGARLAICPPGVLSADEIGEYIRANGVTTLWMTAGMFHEIAAADPAAFGGLRRLVSGGDVVSPDHCARVLRQHPHLEIVNAYGPTENTVFTSCHLVSSGNVDALGNSVPIGRPTAGTRCYVLDKDLNLVPIGVPGELYVGGGGLARGYAGQPGMTAGRFVADPFCPGARLYRTGDVVRWRADGELDFIGRVDDQVKIRGFRIEVGEVEAALRRHPDVTGAVVVAREDDLGHKRLIGYAVAAGSLSPDELRAFAETVLPGHLVPGALMIVDEFPLTANGKVDRKALPAPRMRAGHAYVAPRGPDEELLARVWAEVLGVAGVGRNDNFFDLGGDSILSIQVVSRARQLGLRLTSKDVFLRQTLAALASCATRELAVTASQGPVSGPVPLSPIQHWFFETTARHPEHFNQWVSLELAAGIDREALRAAVEALPRHHDALRMRFELANGEWRQHNAGHGTADVACLASAAGPPGPAGFRLDTGPLLRATLVESTPRPRLVLTAHHLVVDGVSWRILLEDLRTAYRQAAAGQPVALAQKTTSFRDWSHRLREHVAAGGFDDRLGYWKRVADVASAARDEAPPPVQDKSEPEPERRVTATLAAADTEALLREVCAAYRARADDVLLSALGRVLCRWTGRDRIMTELEGHGREEIFDDIDLSRTVGWFTTLYPVELSIPAAGGAAPDGGWATVVKSVKEQLRAVPDRGLSYGALRYLARTGAALTGYEPLLSFNYLGRFDTGGDDPHIGAPSAVQLDKDTAATATSRLDVTAFVAAGGRLEFEWTYSPRAYDRQTVARFAEQTIRALREIVAHLGEPASGGCTPSDFPLTALSQAELDRVTGDGRLVEDMYRLTSMQAGMLFHSLSQPGSYLEQICFTLADVPDPGELERRWQRVVDSTPILRTAVLWDGLSEPVQVVHAAAALPVVYYDWSGIPVPGQEHEFRELLGEDRAAGLDLASPPLMRVTLIRLAGTAVRVVWTFHHLVLDGWSTFQVLSEVLSGSAATRRPFRDYIDWLSRQDEADAERHWRKVLAGFRSPTRLPFDRPPGLAHRAHATATVGTGLPAAGSAELYGYARRHRLTVNAVVQGAWAILLGRHSGQHDICFGAVVSGRPPELPGVDSIAGMFVNTVPVRVRADETGDLAGWLRRLQAQQIESRRFEHASLTTVQRWSEVPAGTGLFDSIIAFENYPFDAQSLAAEGLHLENLAAVEATNYPLSLIAHGGTRHSAELTFVLGYDPGLFDRETAEALAAELVDLLDDLARGDVRPPPETAVEAAAVPDASGPGQRAYVPPRNPTEAALARIWADVLAVDRVGVDDDFFALGGDSILSIRVAARLREEFGATLPPRALFDNPTVAGLALMFGHPTVGAMARLMDRGASPARDYEL